MTALPLAFAALVALVATIHDLRTRTLPNWLTLGAAALAVPLHLAVRTPLASVLFGAIVCSVLPFVLVRRGGLGHGDLKLFCALGAILGPSIGLEAQVCAFGAAFTVSPFLWGKRQWIPFAPAILVGVLVVAFFRR